MTHSGSVARWPRCKVVFWLKARFNHKTWKMHFNTEEVFFHLYQMNKCVFLDRDGVLNEDNPNYTYRLAQFKIIPGVIDALYRLKEAGYLLVVVTNQSGITQGIYTQTQMQVCHIYLQEACDHLIDHFYFCPYHPTVTNSLARKPGTLLFEKAMARFNINPRTSWMVGDQGRDIIPAHKLGINTIQIGDEVEEENRGDYKTYSLFEAAGVILDEELRKQIRKRRWTFG